MQDLAPIVLFVYNRPEHTEKALNALFANELAQDSTLYIYADGPKDGIITQRIKETRRILRAKQWCKEVIISESETNIGLAKSVISGVTSIIDKHGKIIVLEDDLLTSVDFLTFMNSALNYYNGNSKVAGVSGFSYQIEKPINSVYFLPIGTSWGWGTWKYQWDRASFDSDVLLSKIEGGGLVKKFDFGGCPFYSMLKDQKAGRIDSWAIRFYASYFLEAKCFVFPPLSLIQNIGFDSMATHTSSPDNFVTDIHLGRVRPRLIEPIFDECVDHVQATFEKQYSRKRGSSRKVKRFFSMVKKKITLLLGN